MVNVTEVLQMLQSRNNFTLYRTKVPDAFLTRARRCIALPGVYMRRQAGSWKLETSWKGAENMWIIGAGIMVCGLLSMVFAPMLLSFAIMGIGALIAWACSEEEHRNESRRNAWRKAYPTYKY